MSRRNEIYAAIDGEREYQDDRFPTDEKSARTIPGELTLIEVYARRAQGDWVFDDDNHDTLCAIRKIAALAVRCMENHGYVTRAEEES